MSSGSTPPSRCTAVAELVGEGTASIPPDRVLTPTSEVAEAGFWCELPRFWPVLGGRYSCWVVAGRGESVYNLSMISVFGRQGWLLACLGGWLLLVAGCYRADIRVYEAPREKPARRVELPAGWEETPGGAMRRGSYVVRGTNGATADVSIIALPAGSGSELDNVNRWRGQVQLPNITEAELAKEKQKIQVAGGPAHLFEMAGKSAEGEPTRILAAVYEHGNEVWFFKMMGNDPLVKEQKGAFVEFLAKYDDGHGHAHSGEGHATETGSGSSGTTGELRTGTSAVQQKGPDWVAPGGWERQTPGPMQDAKYVAAGGKVVVTVSIFDGPAGGLLANVNRWRGQIGLPAVQEADVEKLLVSLDLPDATAKLLDMSGPKERMVAAVVHRGPKTWYFKMMGEGAAVGSEKKAFLDFVKSTK